MITFIAPSSPPTFPIALASHMTLSCGSSPVYFHLRHRRLVAHLKIPAFEGLNRSISLSSRPVTWL